MTKKSLNQHYMDNQQQQASQQQSQHQQANNGDTSQDMDQLSGRIVVINNNNTNINIHHPNSFQNSHQFTQDNIQSLQETYNLAQLNNQMVNGMQQIKA